MTYIKKLAEHMLEEVEGAKEYAEKAIECKAKGNQQNAMKYKAMAEDELRHAMFFHDLAVKEVEDISKVYEPPVEMMDKWEHEHKQYVQDVAFIRQMLAI